MSLRSKTDQRGVRHEYAFDYVARLTADRVTAVPDPNVDCAVLRIETAYDELGRTSTITSYDSNAAGGGNVLNQVAHSYDANIWGALVATAQSHSGAAGAGTPTGGKKWSGTSDPLDMGSPVLSVLRCVE